MKKNKFISFEELLYYYHLHGNLDNHELPKLTTHKQVWFFNEMLGIINELRENKISTSDYINLSNLGIKPNGNLGMFDMGFGDDDEFDNDVETLIIKQKNLIQNILSKIGVNDAVYLDSGFFGYAYDLQNGLVLKITKDKSEAVNSNKIKEKTNKHLCDIKNVMKFNTNKTYYIIIMEKLDISNFDIFKTIFRQIDDILTKKLSNFYDPKLLDRIELKHNFIGQFLKYMYKNGYEKAWDKYKEQIKQNNLGYDFNDISDISNYIEGSSTISKWNDGTVPKHVKQLINNLIK